MSKDFTDDFLKILRSGFNSEEELESAFNKAKTQYAKEKEEKEKAEKEEKIKKEKIDKAFCNLYSEYLHYLKAKYPNFEPTTDTGKAFKEELDFIDYAIGATDSVSKNYSVDDLTNREVDKIFKKLFGV